MSTDHREDLIRALPHARRYARALTGSQARGDALVADSLRALLAEDQAGDSRFGLYRQVTQGYRPPAASPGGLSTAQRQLLLLTTLEELPLSQAASLVSLPLPQAEEALSAARAHLRDAAAADVLIIEDEPIIAMDIGELVEGCGHRVIGIAASEAEAVALARARQPGLILADINLGPGGDGMQAVARILALLEQQKLPVIFVTAYPERLLTGQALEPAFVITKPFEPLTLAIATYQAVTGGINLEA